jgi:disulfide bond formation protein DsbB
MRIRFFWLTVILFLTAFVSACGGSSQGGSSSTQGGESNGEQLFTANCSACHGVGGVGIQGLGKPLTTSEFVGQLSDEELLNFIKIGRLGNDPLNTTGIPMPPKGGNPALTDEEIKEIIAYLRSIHQ